ncbi:MAG: 30S ribosomal protein S6 [Candidatus Sumerlaeia bacterium]
MAQNYECALLMDPSLSEDQVSTHLDNFSQQITDRGGEIVHKQVWGQRRLEYPIKGRSEAIYSFLYFRMDSAQNLVDEFERQVRIQDTLLRELTVKVSELKIVEAPSSDSRFSEAARLAASGNRRYSGGRGGGGRYSQRNQDSSDQSSSSSSSSSSSAASSQESSGSENESNE